MRQNERKIKFIRSDAVRIAGQAQMRMVVEQGSSVHVHSQGTRSGMGSSGSLVNG